MRVKYKTNGRDIVSYFFLSYFMDRKNDHLGKKKPKKKKPNSFYQFKHVTI